MVTTTVAFLVQNWAQRRTTATRAAILFTFEPGGGLIVVGVLVVELVARGPRRDKMKMMSRATTPIASYTSGNRIFEDAVASLRLNDVFARRLLGQLFGSVGSSPDEVTADELGLLLPEIERRMLLALPFETAAPAMARLRAMLIDWEE